MVATNIKDKTAKEDLIISLVHWTNGHPFVITIRCYT